MQPVSLYLEHAAMGLLFMGSGMYARNFCRHWWHQLAVGLILWILETVIVVTVIG